jgi:hypothetical protein
MIAQLHPADGYFEFVAFEEVVALRCHWPLDLVTNEWVDIQNHYLIADYLQGVGDAISTGSGEVLGVSGGYLKILSTADGFVIEFSRPQDGWSASSLQLHVKRPISDLLPKQSVLYDSISISLNNAWQGAPPNVGRIGRQSEIVPRQKGREQ